MITVETAWKWNAGTKAEVYFTLYGKDGDTGIRHLGSSKKVSSAINCKLNSIVTINIKSKFIFAIVLTGVSNGKLSNIGTATTGANWCYKKASPLV